MKRKCEINPMKGVWKKTRTPQMAAYKSTTSRSLLLIN